VSHQNIIVLNSDITSSSNFGSGFFLRCQIKLEIDFYGSEIQEADFIMKLATSKNPIK